MIYLLKLMMKRMLVGLFQDIADVSSAVSIEPTTDATADATAGATADSETVLDKGA